MTFIAAFLVPLMISAGTAPAASENSVATAIASLTRNEQEIDVQYIGRTLKLPGLLEPSQWNGNSLVWSGPVDGQMPILFAANYKPKGSVYGISKLTIVWWLGGVSDGHAIIYNSLEITFEPNKCPAEKDLTAALGIGPIDVPTPSYSHPFLASSLQKVYTITQSVGRPVEVSLLDAEICTVKIEHARQV